MRGYSVLSLVISKDVSMFRSVYHGIGNMKFKSEHYGKPEFSSNSEKLSELKLVYANVVSVGDMEKG